MPTTLPGRNHSYTPGTYYTLKTTQERLLCQPELYANGVFDERKSFVPSMLKGEQMEAVQLGGLTIYPECAWIVDTLDELETIYKAIAPRLKQARSFEKAHIPCIIRFASVAYSGALPAGVTPMVALKAVEVRELRPEEKRQRGAAQRQPVTLTTNHVEAVNKEPRLSPVNQPVSDQVVEVDLCVLPPVKTTGGYVPKPRSFQAARKRR